jgi:hypothetical protein
LFALLAASQHSYDGQHNSFENFNQPAPSARRLRVMMAMLVDFVSEFNIGRYFTHVHLPFE